MPKDEMKDFKWLKSIRVFCKNGYIGDEDCQRIEDYFNSRPQEVDKVKLEYYESGYKQGRFDEAMDKEPQDALEWEEVIEKFDIIKEAVEGKSPNVIELIEQAKEEVKHISKPLEKPLEWEKEFDNRFCQKGGLADWKWTEDKGDEVIEFNMADCVKDFIRSTFGHKRISIEEMVDIIEKIKGKKAYTSYGIAQALHEAMGG